MTSALSFLDQIALMDDVAFLGISSAKWELINSFAGWFMGLATLAAVGVSLHLANRFAAAKAQVSVGID